MELSAGLVEDDLPAMVESFSIAAYVFAGESAENRQEGRE